MHPPTPHHATITRIPRSDGETYAAPVVVVQSEPCLFAPYQPYPMRATADAIPTFMGPAPVTRMVLFIAHEVDIQLGDQVVNDDTGEIFVVAEPPIKYQDVTTFTPDHQQVLMWHKAAQAPL